MHLERVVGNQRAISNLEVYFANFSPNIYFEMYTQLLVNDEYWWVCIYFLPL